MSRTTRAPAGAVPETLKDGSDTTIPEPGSPTANGTELATAAALEGAEVGPSVAPEPQAAKTRVTIAVASAPLNVQRAEADPVREIMRTPDAG
jgi:hypothetical protein